MNPGKIFHSNSIGSPSIPHNTDMRWIIGSLEVDLCPFNRGNIQHLECTFPDQSLSDVEQRLELFEIGVPVRNRIFHCGWAHDELMLSSLLT